jgi:hypothetical protein
MNVIGLGGVGSRIAAQFERYPQYNVVCVDHDQQVERTIRIKKHNDPEAYESTNIDLTLLYGCLTSDDVIMIVSGGSLVSALSLRILEGIKDRNITIVSVEADPVTLSHKKALNQKVVTNVLQHFTRSGKFERIYLINNQKVEEIAGELPIIGYWDQINALIANTLHMINVYRNNSPIMGSLDQPTETNRISTIGIKNLEDDVKKMFYGLADVREESYIYAISESRLSKSNDLLKRAKEEVKSNTTESKTVSFSFYPTKYDRDLVYVLEHTSFVQEQR